MNADAQFKDFVARQQRPTSIDDALDWIKERNEWLAFLDQLYATIAEYLDDYIKNGAIALRESMIELNEENIGVYPAKRLAILIGAQEIVLTPVGTLLIGSKGRVDVEGSAGHARLVLIDKTITDPRSMVRVTVTVAPSRNQPRSTHSLEPPRVPETIEWEWKIVSRPPAMRFIELNRDSLFEMLMEVSNG